MRFFGRSGRCFYRRAFCFGLFEHFAILQFGELFGDIGYEVLYIIFGSVIIFFAIS